MNKRNDDPKFPNSQIPIVSGVKGAPAGPNWPSVVALALIVAGFSVLNPMLLIFVPVAFMLVALEPRTSWMMMVAAALLVTTFTGVPDGSGAVLWWYSRGWAL